jgi:hypothetical protein
MSDSETVKITGDDNAKAERDKGVAGDILQQSALVKRGFS